MMWGLHVPVVILSMQVLHHRLDFACDPGCTLQARLPLMLLVRCPLRAGDTCVQVLLGNLLY